MRRGETVMAKKSIRLKALQEVLSENGINSDTIELNDTLIRGDRFKVCVNLKN